MFEVLLINAVILFLAIGFIKHHRAMIQKHTDKTKEETED